MSKRLLVVLVLAGLAWMVGSDKKIIAGAEASFIDPTATVVNKDHVKLGGLVYVAPYALLKAGTDEEHAIEIGSESDVQDSVILDSSKGKIQLGEQVILAHGATVKGAAKLGETGTCPKSEKHCPSFVGFNAEVDGAIIEKDAMVSSLARVGSGVTIPSGRKVLPGKNVTSNAEVTAKTAEVTEADREFMHGVIEVNVAFAQQYAALAAEDSSNVLGINFDPGKTKFNASRDLPTLAGQKTRDPQFRNRIIGDVRLHDREAELAEVMGSSISLRADEGEVFEVGSIVSMGNRTTFHALEHSEIRLGDNGHYGYRSLVHGGPTPFKDTTISGNNLTLGDYAVFFRSRIGDNSKIGHKSLVQQSDLPAGTIIPDRTVVINNEFFGPVEW